MKQFFGGSESQQQNQSSSSSGFGALPGDIQNQYKDLLGRVQGVFSNPDQYFAPMGLTAEEGSARDLINQFQDPDAYRKSIETFLNPFRGIITDDINQQFEAPQSALKSRASEAGAFGSSRQRQGEADLEGERFNAIARAMSQQYGQAVNQRQQTISDLLGFGGLERGVDFAQRQALPNALNFGSNIFSRLLNASSSASSGSSSMDNYGDGVFGSLFPNGLTPGGGG